MEVRLIIIGRNDAGYIASLTHDEAIKIAGHHYSHTLRQSDDYKDQVDRDGMLKIGVTLQISKMWDWMHKLRESIAAVKGAAEVLRTSAIVAEMAIPDSIAPPEDEIKF